jgi:hypothetical protein
MKKNGAAISSAGTKPNKIKNPLSILMNRVLTQAQKGSMPGQSQVKKSLTITTAVEENVPAFSEAIAIKNSLPLFYSMAHAIRRSLTLGWKKNCSLSFPQEP